MQDIITFLKANTTVFLATSDQGEARVRPFQFQFEENGRLWFCTSKQKEVYTQLQKDPRVEFSATSPDMVTVRVKGQAILEDSMAIKEKILANNALIRSLYGSAQDTNFTVFSLDHGTAIMFDFSGNPPKKYTF